MLSLCRLGIDNGGPILRQCLANALDTRRCSGVESMFGIMRHFQSLEVVYRGSETQFKVSEN